MKFSVAAISFAALLLGCSPSADLQTPKPTAVPSAPPPQDAATEPSTPPPAPALRHPNRVNQLDDLQVKVIKANGHPIRAWLMDNESKRQEGMMFLTDKDVADDQGMLFVFPEVQPNDGQHGFWMKNCPLALDIIYISPEKRVLNVGKGIPFNETSVPPAGDYKYVLELKQGMAEKYGIKKGTVLDLSGITAATE